MAGSGGEQPQPQQYADYGSKQLHEAEAADSAGASTKVEDAAAAVEAEHAKLLSNSHYNPKKFIIRCVLFASFSMMLAGYDVGIMSSVILFVRGDFDLSTLQISIVVSILTIFSAVGAIMAGKISDTYGRKRAVEVAAVLFAAGALVMSLSVGFWTLLVGRVLAGLGVGSGMLVAPLYTAELSPVQVRGQLVSTGEIAINAGILLGYLFGFALAGLPPGYNWRWMLGLGVLPALVILACMVRMPESPQFLMSQGRDGEAEAVLRQSCRDREEVDSRMQEIRYQRVAGSWRDILRPTKTIRRIIILGIGINFFQQATGIEAVVYYTPATLQQAGITNTHLVLLATVAVGLAKTSSILIATMLLDKAGRRPLLLVAASGATGALLLIAASFAFKLAAYVTLVGQILFVVFFSIGYGPICWVILSEIFPTRIRGRAMSLGALTNRLASGSVAFGFLSLTELITPGGTFLLFAGVQFLSILFVVFLVPETRGKSLEELEAEVAAAAEAEAWDDVESKKAPPPSYQQYALVSERSRLEPPQNKLDGGYKDVPLDS
eukprot:jgi/Chlat1/6946/Chrsp52S06616